MATENKNTTPVVENNASVENATPQTEVKVSVEVETTKVENTEAKKEEPQKVAEPTAEKKTAEPKAKITEPKAEKKPTTEKKSEATTTDKKNNKKTEPTAKKENKPAKEKKTSSTPTAEKTDKKVKKTSTTSKEKKPAERTIPEPPVIEDDKKEKAKVNKKKPTEAKAKKPTEKKTTEPTAEKKPKEKKTAEPKAKTLEIEEAPKKKSLADMIKEAASSKYPYRNANGMTMIDAKTRKKLSDEEYEKVSRHRSICQELVRLSSENKDFPFTALVYFAVGSDAHKKNVFEKGYKTINVTKAETILRWLDLFAKHNKNPKFYTCEKIVHAFAKYYDTQSKKDKDFKAIMKQFVKQPAEEGFKASQYKTMEQFYSIFTKPIIVKTEVKEDGTEKVVSARPNPLAGKKSKKQPKTTAVAS